MRAELVQVRGGAARIGGAYSLEVSKNSRLQVNVQPQQRSVVLEGDVDLMTAPEVERAVAELGLDGDVALAMDAVGFLDSSGLRMIIATQMALHDAGHRLLIVDPSAAVRRVLEITGLEDKLDVTDS